ncbi:Hypothetical protein PHPALM_37591 [Phytophthora palmivora]|uniref:Uncharacterized protein n=1 Tax=Phytophthora palmivora TaxID=4796 RepID=A0A2P4WX11_9STRA|nr:Hypothetical protein PHPALM_37591 [Phytophthora palmivora]
MFERWGETLTVDFTHQEPRQPYLPTLIVYCWCVGCLAVTTATSRGIPAFDFMCLNENPVLFNAILEYSKETFKLERNQDRGDRQRLCRMAGFKRLLPKS